MLIQIEGRPPRRTEALSPETAPPVIGHRPDWLKVPLSHGPHFKGLKKLMREQNLHTICEEAVCPNIGECWGASRPACVLFVGDTGTRNGGSATSTPAGRARSIGASPCASPKQSP